MQTFYNYFKNHPFGINGLFAFPLLVFVVLMGDYFPLKSPEGYQSFIIAFEFTKTIQDINLLFSGLSVDEIQRINIGNYIDFSFMLTYSLFLISLFRKASKEFNKKWLKVGILLAAVALFSDILENLILLKITEIYLANLNESLFSQLLEKLHLITWLKWGTLTFNFLLFSVEIFRKNWLGKTVAFFCFLPVAVGFWAIGGTPIAITYFTNSIFLAFTVLIIYSFFYKKENKPANL